MKLSRARQERLLTVASPIAFLAIWQALSEAGALDSRYIPAPLDIFRSGWDLVVSGQLPADIGASLYRLGLGFALGAIPGFAVGIVMGLNRIVRAVIDPLVAAIYPVPKIAILPLLMLAFGIGDGSKIAAVAMSVFFLTVISTMTGVRSIDPVYFEVAKSFGTPWHKLFLRVILPGSMTTLFAGLRISLGVSLVVLVGAEFVASQSGLGHLIWDSWQTLVVENMFVGIIAITVLGVLSTVLLKELERYLLPWRDHDR